MNALRRRMNGQGRGVRRAVILMPNGLTLFNLFCGIYAIILALHGRFAEAPGFIVLGGIADTLDGRVARATGTGSRFGEELDSLVDAISFGFAPALIVFLGRPPELQGNLDWLLVFIFTSCAVMRLARFNVEQAGRKKTHFHGLPSPAAGLTLATYYWFAQTPLYNQAVILFTDSRTLATLPWPNMLRGLMAILAALMVSDVPYPAVPSIGFNSVRKILGTLAIAGSLVLLLVRREEFIFPALIAYVAYGVVKWMILGFIGRSSTPDEIFWEREAELHQEDERRSAFDRPFISKEALEEAEDDEDLDDAPRPARERSPRRDDRREERRPKRRDGSRREEGRRDEPRRGESKREERSRDERSRDEEPRRNESKRDEEPRRSESKRDEPRRERPRRQDASAADSPRAEQPRSESRPEGRTEPRGESRSEPRSESRSDAAADPLAMVPESGATEPSGEPTGEELRDSSGRPQDGPARKRRRRRGRGSRSRGDGSSGGESGGESGGDAGGDTGGDSGDFGSDDSAFGGASNTGEFSGGDSFVPRPPSEPRNAFEPDHSRPERQDAARPERQDDSRSERGDNPPGPSLPSTPNPSGPTE